MTQLFNAKELEIIKQQLGREPSHQELVVIRKNLDNIRKSEKNIVVIDDTSTMVSIEDGVEFISKLRKEANKQKAIRTCESFGLQATTTPPSQAIETQLADSFEIIDEYDSVDLELLEDDE